MDTAVTVALVGCPVVVLALIILAVKGVMYRGAYFAIAVGAFLLGVFLRSIIPGSPSPSDDAATRAGVQFLQVSLPPLIFLMYSAAIGGVIGGVGFRKRAE